MRLAIALLLLPFLCLGADISWQDALQHIRANVSQQLSRVANYTCVESVDRSYFVTAITKFPGCGNYGKVLPKQWYMRDRLRLDVAVSEGQEIFRGMGARAFLQKV